MTMLSKTSLGIAAAAAGAFVCYCVYFDRKRRSDPNFRQKLKERRKKAASNQSSKRSFNTKFPDPDNQEACQQYFMQEIQLGEVLLSNGQLQEGVEHLANAVVVCGQPQHLLQVFAQTLPPEVVQLLTMRIPVVRQRMLEAHGSKPTGSSASVTEKKSDSPKLAEDDVE